MRHLVTALVLSSLVCLHVSLVFSQPLAPNAQTINGKSKTQNTYLSGTAFTFDISAGYRTDKLNWSIAGNLQGSNPNVRSELSWTNLSIYQLKLANRTVIGGVYVRGYLDYGMVVSGRNQDSDYNGDNRTLEFSRSVNGTDGNYVWDGSVGVGPRFSFLDDNVVVCPMLGYAISEQDLNIVDGYQAFSAPPLTTPVGPIAGLDSLFQARWMGPWLGVDLFISSPTPHTAFSKIGVLVTGEYHWVDYDADANWNLRSDYAHPVSFTQEADGSGYMAGVTFLFEIKNRWGFHAGMNIIDMTTEAGLDRTYYANGTTNDTRLNEARWKSLTIEAGWFFQF
jgi:hypothetical protein